MSATELIGYTLADLSRDLQSWRAWAARRVCDCEALSQCRTDVELADADRHRDGCRFKMTALDLSGE